jgi:ABC-2 type transport system ATP-binding protein
MSSLITVNNLTRHYGDFCAVNDISFELATGDILGFLGPNGAGKSSTMQMLTGNLAPTLGEIVIDGIDLLDEPKKAKSALGYLPENPPLYRELTVIEYLHYCAQLHRLPKPAADKACASAIERCGLGEVRQRLIKNLSKGYQQRVGIAQAILHSPPVIILDEPTVGLDPIQILEIRKLIKELGNNHGIILCTHILPEVQAVCNRVQIINRGELVYNADLEDMLGDKQNRFDVSISSNLSQQELDSHDIFSSVEKTGEFSFIAESDAGAERLTTYIVEQRWGLTRFITVKDTLENIFISLTTGDDNRDTDRPEHTSKDVAA